MYKNSLKVIHPRMKCYYSWCKLGGLHIPTINSSFLLRRYSYTPDLKDTSPTSNFSKITDGLSITADTELSPSKTANISCPWGPWAGKRPSPGSLPAHLVRTEGLRMPTPVHLQTPPWPQPGKTLNNPNIPISDLPKRSPGPFTATQSATAKLTSLVKSLSLLFLPLDVINATLDNLTLRPSFCMGLALCVGWFCVCLVWVLLGFLVFCLFFRRSSLNPQYSPCAVVL